MTRQVIKGYVSANFSKGKQAIINIQQGDII